ncbi:hypothetical protein [Methylobacterium sp. Leaf456]|uniref:hypothetical protein n=1 Tax=Methylobacterium sp. Leaf456 TaxID=1736382 RepID=UPI0006F9628C|nr:hypothetical protein [Methylobacterium sp. Leaf456]
MSEERRRLTRLNGFKIAICRSVDESIETECLIWNHNDQGALLEFTDPATPTETFRLVCAELGIDTLCHVIWRDGRERGVVYPTPSP